VFSDVLLDARGAGTPGNSDGENSIGPDDTGPGNKAQRKHRPGEKSDGNNAGALPPERGPANDVAPLTINALSALLLNGGPAVLAGAEQQLGTQAVRAGADESGPPQGVISSEGQPDRGAQDLALSPFTLDGEGSALSPRPSFGDPKSPAVSSMRDAPKADPPADQPGSVAGAQHDPVTSAQAHVSSPESARMGAVPAATAPPVPIAAPREGGASAALRAIDSIGSTGGVRPTQTGYNPGSNGGGLNTQDLRKVAQGDGVQDDRAVASQVAKGLMAALKNGGEKGGEVVLRLQPRALGDLRIRVAMNGQSIGAEFHASTTQARELLRESLTHLRAELESRGLSVHRLDVQLSPRPEPTPGHAAPTEGNQATGQGGYLGQGQSGRQQPGSDPGADGGAHGGSGSWRAGVENRDAGSTVAPAVETGGGSEWLVDMIA
jgi:hypothetical protein